MSTPTPSPSYICRNGLAIAYIVLKTKLGRFLDNTHISPLEDFYEKVGRSNGLAPSQYTLSNSEVEHFYTGQTSEPNFVATAESRLVRAAISPAGSPVSLMNICPLGNGSTVNTGQPGLTSAELKLLTVIWDMYCMVEDISLVSTKVPRVCGMCLWQMFLCLDKDGQKQVSVSDVYELVNLIFKMNGHSIELETVEEWFCGERMVDFRCFLQSLVEGYAGLLQASTIQDLYAIICLKQLKQGKLMKKGHVVHNWKWRWFILTTADVRYYEAQDSPVPKGCIAITATSQVQTMADTRGHPFKFRVVDGNSGTATEISCPDEPTRREWMDAIKLAVRLTTIEGRNFIHCYAQALESAPKYRGMVLKKLKDGTTVSSPTTSPTHKALASSKSVPLDVSPKKDVGRGKKRYPMTPQEEHRLLGVQQPEVEEEFDRGDDEPPPLPPQRLDSGDIRNLQLKRPVLAEYDVQGSGGSQKSPRIPLRRTSSAGDLEESVKHLQVGEEEYALVSKVPKKKKEKKSSAPAVIQEVLDRRTRDPASRTTANGQRPISHAKKRSPPMPKKKSPPLPFQKKKSEERLVEESNGKSPPPPVVAKPTGNLGYAELRFFLGGETEFINEGKPSSDSKAPALSRGGSGEEEPPVVPHDPKTKFGYSTILFDEAKQKDIIAAERLKKERSAPPPIPNKYQGGGKKAKKLRQYVSDSSTTTASSLQPKEQKFQGKARPISAGTTRTPVAGLSAQNGVNPVKSSFADYEIMDDEFNEEEEEFENVPRKAQSSYIGDTNSRGGNFSPLPPPPNRQASSGYKIVELENDDRGGGRLTPGGVDRQNQPLPPLPGREQNTRPQQLPTRSVQQNGGAGKRGGGGGYGNNTAATTVQPPQPKPRVTPRKYVTTPTHHTPPVPPRKTS